MRALLLNAENKSATVHIIPRPLPSDGELLIRVEAVALNPVDSLYVLNPLGETGRTVGSDFSGTVIESNSPTHQVGQRVAGFLQGACSINNRPGAFAEYLVCPADQLWRIPDPMTLEEASTVSLCALTAAQGLFYRLGMRAPFSWPVARGGPPGTESRGDGAVAPFSVFIYGASTSVGMYAAQLVRRSAEASGAAVKLIGAASPARFPLLQAEPYTYDALVDYRDSNWPGQVRTLTGAANGVDFVYDCISEGATVKMASSTLREGGKMAIVRSREGGAFDPDSLKVDPVYGAVWEAFGVEIQYQNLIVPASHQARAFAGAFYTWLSSGPKLTPNPVRLMPGGLERIVPDGFALLGSGSMQDRAQHREEPHMKPVSAEKLVYSIAT
ncbi:gag-pol polyprotein [Colletotrichum tofieldiae]|uniref:Gag-pol polyprotein n=1 Tax=Colletotrichum tofieldiae TaxID=708197 RepID=A0A166RN49_9PEZI|nr:gag-pol polyprotein [Colletotrichum tofieldiae]GKT89596.1 gag-pol polyprotein [Colletotrichum tofieldiae]